MLKFLKNLFVFFLSLTISLVIIDIYVNYAEIENVSIFEVEPGIGKVLTPNLKMLYLNEGFHMGQVNEYSYFGPGYSPNKEADVLRVALIGDSQVEGHYMFDRHHFRSVLEKELAKLSGKKVEVLNFGYGGIDIGGMYCRDFSFASKFNPDLTVYFVGAGDFVVEHDPLYPNCYLENDSLKIDYNLDRDAYESYLKTRSLRENSTLMKMLSDCIGIAKEGRTAEIVLEKFYTGFSRPNTHPATEQLEQNSPIQIPAIAAAILKDLSQREDKVLVLRRDFPEEAMPYIQNSKCRIIVLDKAFDGLRAKGIDPQYWPITKKHGHWNHAANQAIGDYLARKIEESMLAKSQVPPALHN
ncbi:MAG: SGNH/GDSL hydrolase family protein [Chlorobiales bacterium]|nr:SGNH/GDSL hydrolase family protein [Chlorobiales bacterium]